MTPWRSLTVLTPPIVCIIVAALHELLFTNKMNLRQVCKNHQSVLFHNQHNQNENSQRGSSGSKSTAIDIPVKMTMLNLVPSYQHFQTLRADIGFPTLNL